MNRFALIAVAASGLVFAQTQPPSGGWRRVGDPPPAQTPATAPATAPSKLPTAVPATPQGADPEPVDRSDAYGQPVQTAPPQQPPEWRQDPQPQMRRPAYGLPAEITMRPGTFLTVRMAQSLSSDRNLPGDTFVAHLAQPIVVDGVVVANRGQSVYGRVAEAVKAKSGHSSRLGLELTSLTLADGNQVPIKSQLVARTGTTTPVGDQVATVGTTTAVGAVVGAAADWGTGAAIGAGVGAVAGLAGVLLTRNHPTIVYPETALTFEMQAPVMVSTVRVPQAFRYVGPEDYNQPVNAELRPRPPVRYGPAPYYYGPYAYPYPYYAPYPYWGPTFGVGIGVWGRGGHWGHWR